MKITASKVFCVFMSLALASCAFSTPENNLLRQNNLFAYNYDHVESFDYDPPFPNPIKPDHPLYEAVTLGDTSSIPEMIRNINIAIASDEQFKEALKETLSDSHLLAPDAAHASYFLDVNYIENSFLKSSAQIQWKLRKKDETTPILDREIFTQIFVTVSGSLATWKTARSANAYANMVNIASITWCLEQYNGASFPADCTLHLKKR